MRHLAIASLTCFGISFLVGLYVTPYVNDTAVNNLADISIAKFPVHTAYISILKTNLTVIARLLIGAILFALPTFVSLGINGYYLGSYTATAILNNSLTKFLILTFPHCIFEIPAIIIAGAAGFKIPYEITRYLAGRKEQILTRQDIKDYVTLALISIALIIIAAWVEANITLRIAESMMNSSGG